ncbi:MAG: hypothetical protein M0033_09280 [Nitrospiraceae bacterium]|nr:hypothetical protein [Nitrospiraceae bacterium]MDA8326399.1 hypothetical protein [Nitrospiraceae bacterium]
MVIIYHKAVEALAREMKINWNENKIDKRENKKDKLVKEKAHQLRG